MVEHERHGAGLGEVAAVLGEIRAHVGGGAVAVVGHGFDDDGRAAGPVALVADLLVGLGVAALRLLDGALDIVLRHVLGAGGQDGGAQARVHGRIRQAHLGRHRDLARQLAEQLGALRVDAPLAVHDVLELRMAGHRNLRGRRRRRRLDVRTCQDAGVISASGCEIKKPGALHCARAAQNSRTASVTAAAIFACRSGELIRSSSSRLMIEPASNRMVGTLVSRSTTSWS